jgi:hypothetical protein
MTNCNGDYVNPTNKACTEVVQTINDVSVSIFSAYLFGLSATSQQYFSLRTNQPPATSQQYFSLTANQHQPSATSQTNRLVCRYYLKCLILYVL